MIAPESLWLSAAVEANQVVRVVECEPFQLADPTQIADLGVTLSASVRCFKHNDILMPPTQPTRKGGRQKHESAPSECFVAEVLTNNAVSMAGDLGPNEHLRSW